MKQLVLEKTDLRSSVRQAQHERVVIVRNGKPVALIVGVEGLDREQLELGSSDKFWKLIARRRRQTAISRAELMRRISAHKAPKGTPLRRTRRG